MSDNNDEKLNNNEAIDSNRSEIDEIMEGFYNLASIYSDDADELREKELREKEEKRRSREMNAIREDIERRYTMHLEEAIENAESNSGVSLAEQEEEREIPIEDLLPDFTILSEENAAEKQKAEEEQKQKKKESSEPESFVPDEKNSIYLLIYNFGDIISKLIGKLLLTIIKIIVFPFKKLKELVDKLTDNAKKQAREAVKNTVRQANYFKRDIKSAHRSIRKCIKHPLSLPGVLKHYILKAFARHNGLLKTIGNIALPVLSILVMLTVFNYWKGVTFALEVVYNNDEIGYISDESVFIDARDIVIERLSAGDDDTSVSAASFNAGYKLALVSLDKLSDAETISDSMIAKSDEKFTNACGVYIDGEFICAVKNEADARTVFYSILEPYEADAEEKGYIIGFAEDIDYVQGMYRDDAGVMWDASKLEETVLGKEGASMTYTVREGDTLASIAYEHGSTEDEILELNPGLSMALLHIGTNISIPSYTPLVRLKKTVTTSTLRDIEFDVVKQKDATKYSGYRLVKQAGVNGTERVITTKIYISGELYNTEYSFETVAEPVDEIVVVGSRTTYGGVYIGEASDKGFLWPAPHCHYISSPFGLRSSGMHKGIDLCTGNGTAYGSPVIASKSGTVESVQHLTSGYGNMVLINHGDGYKTRYAHLADNSICVSVGEYVEAGKTIGKVGSTGNSSGPHLHFEVIWNGETQDPRNYITQ